MEGQQLLDENPLRVNGLIFCDLDNLKYINDTYGHSTGDRYLQTMADLLRTMARGRAPFRYASPATSSRCSSMGISAAKGVEQKIRDGYEETPRHDPSGRQGGAGQRLHRFWPLPRGNRESMEELLKRADRAMYRIKRGEKNGIAVYGKSDEIE